MCPSPSSAVALVSPNPTVTVGDAFVSIPLSARLKLVIVQLTGILQSSTVSPVTTVTVGLEKKSGWLHTPLTGLVLTGADAGNYVVTLPTTTANISAATLTVTDITAGDKVYDGTTNATIDTSAQVRKHMLGGCWRDVARAIRRRRHDRPSKSGKEVAYLAPRTKSEAQGKSALLIAGKSNQRVVHSLRLAELGEVFIYEPALARGAENVREAQIVQTLPIVVAKR